MNFALLFCRRVIYKTIPPASNGRGANLCHQTRTAWCWSMAEDGTFNVVFVLGRPGSGKGTQCDQIAEEFSWAHFSTGALLRDEVAKGSALGAEIQAIMLAGEPVPSDKTVNVLFGAMEKKAEETKNFLIDGFPMNEENFTKWQEFMTSKVSSPEGVNFVLHLDCPEQICEERVLARGQSGSGRADDNARTVRRRFATYDSITEPILEYFQQKGIVKTVDGKGNEEEVYERVRKLFDGFHTC